MIISNQCATIRMNICGGTTQLLTRAICRHDPVGPRGICLSISHITTVGVKIYFLLLGLALQSLASRYVVSLLCGLVFSASSPLATNAATMQIENR